MTSYKKIHNYVVKEEECLIQIQTLQRLKDDSREKIKIKNMYINELHYYFSHSIGYSRVLFFYENVLRKM